MMKVLKKLKKNSQFKTCEKYDKSWFILIIEGFFGDGYE